MGTQTTAQNRTPKKERDCPVQGAAEADWAGVSHRTQRAFLAAYSECCNVRRAAACVGVNRRRVYEWKAKSEAFRQAMAVAEELGVQALEDEAVRRAQEGLRRYKFTRGGEPIKHPVTGGPYFEHEYSDTLLIFLLKAKRPEVYRERHQIQHAGEVTYVKHVILEDGAERPESA